MSTIDGRSVLTDGQPVPVEQKSPKRKNKYRNRPCPCGSGKKFKNCHWSSFRG